MVALPLALYDAFTDRSFGGSQAAIVSEAAGLDGKTRQKIASELGFPATCFVLEYHKRSVTVRFHSTQKEYPMCGHGTICLFTWLIETEVLEWQGIEKMDAKLCVGSTNSTVEIFKRADGRVIIMLDIELPNLKKDTPATEVLTKLLGIAKQDLEDNLPIEKAYGDFNHLIVPISGLDAMSRIHPDFSGLTQYCVENSIDTVAVFSRETSQPGYDIHVRDFCPAVGVAESAAAGTTNAALSSYLIRHDLVLKDRNRQYTIMAEQGIEIGRPSSIRSVVTIRDGMINRLQVGGVATKFSDGNLYLPLHD